MTEIEQIIPSLINGLSQNPPVTIALIGVIIIAILFFYRCKPKKGKEHYPIVGLIAALIGILIIVIVNSTLPSFYIMICVGIILGIGLIAAIIVLWKYMKPNNAIKSSLTLF